MNMAPEQQILQVLEKFHQGLSGPAGSLRDWDALHALAHPGATFICQSPDEEACVYRLDTFISEIESMAQEDGLYFDLTDTNAAPQGPIATLSFDYSSYADPEKQFPLNQGHCVGLMLKDDADWKLMSLLWEFGQPGK